jgi:hypothetical protein
MTPYLSDKIKVMSFVCIILVVWIHTYYTEGDDYISSILLMNFWGGGVCMLAVPTFYTISGYLFFLNVNSVSDVYKKQKKRIRTLFVPYMLSNVLSIVFYYGLDLVTSEVPAWYAMINNNLLDRASGYGLGYWLYYCFWEGPIAFQLWFVRDLMVLVVLAPITYVLFRYIAKSCILTVLGLSACIGVAFYHANPFTWATGWFCLGGLLAMNKYVNVITLTKVRSWAYLCIVVALGVIVLDAMYIAGISSIFIKQDVITILGVPSVWVLYDDISKGSILCNNRTVATVCGSSFFIYLIHEPFLNIFKKIPLLFDKGEWCINLSYVLCPIAFIIVCIVFGGGLKRWLPKCYGIFTGGRM